MGLASLGNILAPSLGPIAGGLLSQYFGWQAIFWFLAIAAGIFLMPFLLFFPETCRGIVGDGSIKPPNWNRSAREWFHCRSSGNMQATGPHISSRKKASIPNTWTSLRLLMHRPLGLILLVNGLVFGSYYAVTAGIPAQFGTLYGLDDLQIGLCFIPAGLGSLLSATANGMLVDWNFRRTLLGTGQPVHFDQKLDILTIPIEKARLQVGLPMAVSDRKSFIRWYQSTNLHIQISGAACIAIYGFLMAFQSPLWVALLMIFAICFCITAAYNDMNVLIVDLYYTTPATAMAANNLVRCFLGAGAAAAVNPSIQRLGVDWTYFIVSGILVTVTPLLVLVYLYGWEWRRTQAGIS